MHIIFAFASPEYIKKDTFRITTSNPQNNTENEPENEPENTDLPELNHNLEFRTMNETLKSIRKQINYKKVWANSHSLQTIRDTDPSVFHFSGHGFKDDSSPDGKKDFLVIENKNLHGDKLKQKDIIKYFNNRKSIKVALILSCQSYSIGEIFQSCGIEHVVCIRRNDTILDQSCITFTETFYKKYFKDDKTVCEAFEYAVDTVRNYKGINTNEVESQKFKLLTKDSHSFESCKSKLKRIPAGKSCNHTNQPTIMELPEKPKNLIARGKDIIKIFWKLRNEQHIWLSGEAGIGKSEIVKKLANVVFERDIYPNGVLYISLQGCKDSETLLDKFFNTVWHSLTDKNVKNELKEFTNHIIDAKYKACLKAIKDFQILIVFDNCDSYLATRENHFKKFLDNLNDNIPYCSLVITSQKFTNSVFHSKFWNMEVGKLHNEDILKLLPNSQKTMGIMNQELIMLYKDTNSYDEDNPLNRQTLWSHELFDIINGNPLCALHVSSLAIGKRPSHLLDSNMKDIYKDLKEISINMKKDPQGSDINFAFRITTHITMKHLKDDPQSIKGLRCLALCPGGLKLKDLKTLVTYDWYTWIRRLIDKSIVTEHDWDEDDNVEDNFIDKS